MQVMPEKRELRLRVRIDGQLLPPKREVSLLPKQRLGRQFDQEEDEPETGSDDE